MHKLKYKTTKHENYDGVADALRLWPEAEKAQPLEERGPWGASRIIDRTSLEDLKGPENRERGQKGGKKLLSTIKQEENKAHAKLYIEDPDSKEKYGNEPPYLKEQAFLGKVQTMPMRQPKEEHELAPAAQRMPDPDRKNFHYIEERGQAAEIRSNQGSRGMMAAEGLPPLGSPMINYKYETGGGAAIHHQVKYVEMENRLSSQEQMNKYLVNQINTLEEQLSHLSKKYNGLQEEERINRSRIESNLRLAADQNQFSSGELINRLTIIEENYKNENKLRMDLEAKMRSCETGNREMTNLLKQMQHTDTSELHEIRQFMHDKVGEDQLNHVRHHEKSTALFNEVVRLGQENEKNQDSFNNFMAQIENKMQIVESRQNKGEQDMMHVEGVGASGSTMAIQLADKMERKILELENVLDQVTGEVRMQKEYVGRVEGFGNKLNEDVKLIVKQIENDIQTRIEAGVAEVNNKVSVEEEERLRVIEDLKYQMELKDKVFSDKTSIDKDDMREKYSQIDNIIRSELQRKNEVVTNIQTNMETHIKNLHNAIRKEEVARAQMELGLKSDISKLAEQLRTDYEIFKNQQNTLTEKLTEMIKLEVDSRLSAERENKALTQSLVKGVMQEFALFKDTVEKDHKKFAREIKEINSENSERAHFLSRYIDDEVRRVSDSMYAQMSKIRTLCAKLTEHVKEHLQSNESARIALETKLTESLVIINGKIGTFEEREEGNIRELASKLALTEVISRIEGEEIGVQVNQIMREISKLENSSTEQLRDMKILREKEVKEQWRINENKSKELEEIMNRKIQNTLEQLKNENNKLWLDSVKLAEKEFTTAQLRDTLKFIPPTIESKKESGKAINELSMENEQYKPALKKFMKDSEGGGDKGNDYKDDYKGEERKVEEEPSEEDDEDNEEDIEDTSS